MAGFNITSVNFGNTPSGGQTLTFHYKLWSDPDSAYTLISNSASVNTAGVLAIPLSVTGLTGGELYYVRSFNNCDSPPDYFIQAIQL